MDFSDFKVRCSAISMATAESKSSPQLTAVQSKRILELESKANITDIQKDELTVLQLKAENSKVVTLSDTYIGYLMEEYAWRANQILNVTKELDTHQMRKGVLVEPDAVILLTLVDKVAYKHNTLKERVSNEYLSGEVDCWEGETIMGANQILDVKSIWDYIGFLRKTVQPLSKANKEQVQGYMLISGSPVGYIADCLIDTPDSIKMDVMQYLLRKGIKKGQYISEESPDFLFDWAMYDRSMTFSDKFSPAQRINKKMVEPITEFGKQFLYDQVKRGRDFLNVLYEKRSKLN